MLGPTRPDYKWQAKASGDLQLIAFKWIGKNSKLFARREKPVLVDLPTRTLMEKRWLRLSSLRKTVLLDPRPDPGLGSVLVGLCDQ